MQAPGGEEGRADGGAVPAGRVHPGCGDHKAFIKGAVTEMFRSDTTAVQTPVTTLGSSGANNFVHRVGCGMSLPHVL